MSDEATYSGSELPLELKAALAKVCLKNSEYDYVQGDHGGTYFDVDELCGASLDTEDGKVALAAIDAVITRLRTLISERAVNALVFIERDSGPEGLISARTQIAKECGLPAFIARPRRRLIRSRLKGGMLASTTNAVIVSDVSTSGTSIARAAENVWLNGGQVSVAVSLLDHELGARKRLKGLDIDLQPITTVSELDAAKR